MISPVALDVPDPREDTADSLTGQGQAYYQGLRVIWVDDHPRHRQRLVGELRARGADVTEEPDTTAAEHRMRDAKAGAGAPFHLLISDFTRGGDPEAGLLTVERWQEDDTHTGRVIFFSHRVTPAREVRGSKLGALVTSTDDQLLRWAFRIARQIREEAPPWSGPADRAGQPRYEAAHPAPSAADAPMPGSPSLEVSSSHSESLCTPSPPSQLFGDVSSA